MFHLDINGSNAVLSDAPQINTQTDLQTVLEAVGGRLVAAVSVLLPPLAEEQLSLVQEEVPLHGLEASQLLHAGGTPLMADPHAERPLHEHPAQLANVTLCAVIIIVSLLHNVSSYESNMGHKIFDSPHIP